MITYIYPYRNKELGRIKRSLDSLEAQNNKEFNVIFVDYGSDLVNAKSVEKLTRNYSFVKYIYTFSQGKPWNRAKAINIGIKHARHKFLLSADIDMIFHSSFNGVLKEIAASNKVTFFKVGYLSENETFTKKELIPESYSNKRAKGISLYPKEALESIQGFDEFFHCWGAEDEDVISRLSMNGLEIEFYERNVLVFHQYHTPFKDQNPGLLSTDLSFHQVRFHNDRKRRFNLEERKILVNEGKNWGVLMDKSHYDSFVNISISRILTSYKADIDFFLFFELNHLPKGQWGFKFEEYTPEKNFKVKRMLFKLWTITKPNFRPKEYYSLKEVNDLLLKFLIYQDFDFHLVPNVNDGSIELRLNIE